MSMDLGNLTAGVEIDARNAEATLDRLQISFKDLEEAQRKVSKSNVDVSPKGQRQLDAAKGSADKLSAALGTAGTSAKGLTVDRAVATALEGSATSARGLTLALQGAGAAANTIKVDPSAAPVLDKAQTSAGRLAESLNKAGQEATTLGRSGNDLSVFEGGLSRLTKGAQNLIPVLAAATGAGAIFAKGWDRLTGIDNAQFKLQGLGHTAESVGSIMDSAMQSVSGTAYGFGDAASLAAGTVAATGEQGQRLTQILTTVSDVSAISGRSLSDIGLIFNQVASSGVIMGDDLNQLLDSGIPIITYLAEELGVAGSEVKKLASEGKISFETMEAALRNNLGGAAQEMGGSVTGSLSNVGAAFGRLGAEILSGPFSQLPSVLEGAKGGIDLLTSGVSSLYAAWGNLPGPIQAVLVSMAGAKAVSAGLNTELGKKMVDHLKGVKDGAVGMGKGVADAFSVIKGAYSNAAAPMKEIAAGHKNMASAAAAAALENKSAFGAADDMARQAGHTFAATGASMQATARGTMAGAFAGVKMGASGLMAALGGPWGLALAGAGAAAMLFAGQVQKTKQAQEEVKQATTDWADVLTEADGKITDSVQKQALLRVEQADVSKQMDKLGLSAEDMAAAILDVDGAYDGLIAQLDKVIEQGNHDPTAFRGRWYDDNAKAAMEFKRVLEDEVDVMADGQAQAQETARAQGELADRIEQGGSAAGDAEGEFSNLHTILDFVASEAKNVDDAIEQLALELMKLDSDPAVALQAHLAESAAAVQDFGELLSKGSGGFDVETGMFDVWDKQGQALSGTMQGLQQELYQAATAQYELAKEQGASGVDAAAQAATVAEEYTNKLIEQAEAAGWDQAGIEKLIDTYGLAPAEVMTQIHAEGAERAQELLERVNWEMAKIDEDNATLTIDAEQIAFTKERAEELGFTWTDLGSNLVELKANNEQAIAAVQEVADKTEEMGTKDNPITLRPDLDAFARAMDSVEGQVATFITDPKPFPLVVDDAEARRALDTYNAEYVEIDGMLYIEDNTPALMNALQNLGAETAALPEGNLIINSPTDEILQVLDLLGFQVTNLPDGQILVDHNNIVAAMDEMKSLGVLVEGGAKGELKVDSNIIEKDKSFQALKEKVEGGAKGKMEISDNSKQVAEDIDRRLQGKRTDGTHWVTYRETPNAPGRHTGGPIPGLAYGGPAGGYRLPMSGPGTSKVDGILGVDYLSGEPTAWVNRGEYVTNDKSTRKYLRTLEALNKDDPNAILRSLAAEIPRLESGGEVSRRIKSSLAGMDGTPYIFGGWSPSGVDCTGATSLAANLAMDLPMWESRHATMNMGAWLTAKGALPGKGDGDDMVFAFYNGGPGGGHAAMRLPDGTYIESGGNTGSGLTIGGKAGPLEGRGFTDWYHLPYSMNGDEDDELTGDGGTTVGGLGTVKALKRTGGGGTPRAGAAGGAYNVPGFASNTPGGTTIGQSIGGQASAAVTSAFGAGASGVLNTANPFVGNRTWAENLGPQITQQMTGLATQHGFGAEVTAALESFTPNWDVWLRVNKETIEAFNNLQEARDNRKDAAEEITRAEEDLEETRKQLAQLTADSGELSVQNARKLEDAEDSLRKAREGGKADTIATAEKRLARVQEDIAKAAAEGDEKRAKQLATLTENLEIAELNLADAHTAAEKAADDAAAAQQAYNLALQMAPVYAITNLFKAASDNLERLADSFERMNGVMERTRELTVAQENAEIAAVQAKIDLFNNTEEVAAAERNRTQQAHERYLAEQQAEWDLAMAKHDANQVIGASEVDLAELRKQGIYDVMQISDQGNRDAYLAASSVAVAEAVLANTRAQNAASELENDLALTAAQARLEYSQIMAEAQADRLRVATEELAASQGNAADQGMSAIAKETEGKAKRTGGLVDMLVGGLKVAGAVGLAVATGGSALPAALALGASGVADFGGGFAKNQSGKAQEQAYAEEARKEYEALSPEDRKKVDLARAGVPLAAIGGAVVGIAGGSSDDVDNIIAGISDLTRAPLDAEITGRESALDAAAIRRDKQIADIEARERQAELDYKNFQLDQLETNKDQRDYLAELVALTGRQLGEHQQENEQLSELNGTLSGKNQSVLMSIGGSQWGGGSATGTIGLEPVTGFGGLSKTNADVWSTLNVEAGWGNTDRTREVVPWAYGEQEFLDALRNPYIDGLPDTVVPGAAEAAKVPTLSEVQAAAIANYELLLARNQAAAQTTQVDTQFTGPVTIQGQDADDTINELQRQLARG